MRTKGYIIEVIVFLFVVLFLYAAGSKLTEYGKFIAQMGKSPLITNYATTLAWAVPTIEILIAILLIVPKYRMIGMYAAFGLMVLFTLYIAAILTISEELPCSCGGIIALLGWKAHLFFNLFFVALGMLGIGLLSNQNKHNNIAVA